jgi:hypothetical protein
VRRTVKFGQISLSEAVDYTRLRVELRILHIDHILQNYSLDPAALGLENYSRFSAAIMNSIQLNLPCLPPFHKRQPWLDIDLAKL